MLRVRVRLSLDCRATCSCSSHAGSASTGRARPGVCGHVMFPSPAQLNARNKSRNGEAPRLIYFYVNFLSHGLRERTPYHVILYTYTVIFHFFSVDSIMFLFMNSDERREARLHRRRGSRERRATERRRD